MVIAFLIGMVIGGCIAAVGTAMLAYADDREEKVDMGREEY